MSLTTLVSLTAASAEGERTNPATVLRTLLGKQILSVRIEATRIEFANLNSEFRNSERDGALPASVSPPDVRPTLLIARQLKTTTKLRLQVRRSTPLCKNVSAGPLINADGTTDLLINVR